MERSVDRLRTHYLRLDKIYSRHITWDWTKSIQDTLLGTGQNLFKTHYLGLDKTFTGHITCNWTKSIQDTLLGTGQNLYRTHYLGLDKTFTGHITCDWTKSFWVENGCNCDGKTDFPFSRNLDEKWANG